MTTPSVVNGSPSRRSDATETPNRRRSANISDAGLAGLTFRGALRFAFCPVRPTAPADSEGCFVACG